MKRALRVTGGILAAGVAIVAIALASMTARNDREWVPLHARAPIATVNGDTVRIANLRTFRFSAAGVFTPGYQEREYDLSKLESVSYVLTPFSLRWRGPAHSFVTFGFADSQFVAVSVEARREEGEKYSIASGLFNQYELVYVIGDERDLIGQRAAFGDDRVYLYPIKAPRANIRAMFVSMLERANQLREHPEFYNTATNNCTSNIVAHVNAIVPGRVPSGLKTVFPGYSDELGVQLGLFATDLPIEQARAQFQINDRARRFVNDSSFSFRIREPASP